jgi:CelD/BcsL family acetyltransferase involved in cellulose biosynthesis
MAKNYAYESGSFMALAKMMRDEIRKLDSTDDFDRKWAVRFLQDLANQTDATLVEFGYKVG